MSYLSENLPSLIHYYAHARNGLLPDSAFYGATTASLNHLVAYRRKPIFQRTCVLGAAGGTSGAAWRWYCTTGYGAKRLAILAVLGLDDRIVAVDPYIDVIVTKVGGAATTVNFHYGASAVAATDAPDEFSTGVQFVDVDPASNYTGSVTFYDNVRVISLLVFEESIATVDDSNSYFSTYEPVGGSPIMDNRTQVQLEGVGNLIRQNGGLRHDWNPFDGTARTRSSATYINLYDNATTGTPTAATPGVTLVTSYRNTFAATTVPIKMAVYGSIGAGSGHVVLRDTSGNDAADVTINGAAGWYTATGAITVGAGQKYDLMFKGDGVNTVTVTAVSFFEVGT